jgi:hypothetical protein
MSHQGAKQEARTDGLKRDSAKKSWRYAVRKRGIGQREQRQQQGAKQEAETGNGWKDMK